MNTLQNVLETVLESKYSKEKIIVHLMKKKLKEQGFVLNEKQLEDLESRISKNDKSSHFCFEEKDALENPSDLAKYINNGISITLEPSDVDNAIEEISNDIKNCVPDLTEIFSDFLYQKLKKDFRRHQRDFTKGIDRFNKNLKRSWGKAFDLLDMFYYVSLEGGSTFNDGYRPIAATDNNLVFDVITRLHARGCQIFSEIICLLKNGFADGAHARWRTLHELAVIALFIRERGNEIAEKYILHRGVEDYKAALKYQECCNDLGLEKLEEDAFNNIKGHYLDLLNKYSKNFKSEYGWAASAVGKDSPNFADIEAMVGLEHMRPYYKMASHNVHANPKGVFFKLGLLQESEILLSGPSNVGLTDPAHSAAISLLQITTSLLTIDANMDRIVICHILEKLEVEIGEACFEAQRAIEEAAENPQ